MWNNIPYMTIDDVLSRIRARSPFTGRYTEPPIQKDESKMTNRKIPLQYTEEVIDAEFTEIKESSALMRIGNGVSES